MIFPIVSHWPDRNRRRVSNLNMKYINILISWIEVVDSRWLADQSFVKFHEMSKWEKMKVHFALHNQQLVTKTVEKIIWILNDLWYLIELSSSSSFRLRSCFSFLLFSSHNSIEWSFNQKKKIFFTLKWGNHFWVDNNYNFIIIKITIEFESWILRRLLHSIHLLLNPNSKFC